MSTLSTPANTNSPQTWLITSGMALITLLYFFFGFLPGQKAMAGLQLQLKEKQQAVALMDVQALQQQALETQLASMESFGRNWKRKALKPGDLPFAMANLSRQAAATNVSILRLEPQKYPLHLQTVQPVTLAVDIQGSFANSFEFIRRLETLPHPLWIQNLKLTQSGETKGLVRTEMTLTIFANSHDYSDK